MASQSYYFAAAKREDVGRALVGRLEETRKRDSQSSQRAAQYSLAYGHYYGWDTGRGSTSEIARAGDQGELALVRINHARRGAKALLSLLMGPSFSWRPQAPNSDPNARAATIKGSNILEYEMKRRRLALLISKWVEGAILASEAFLFPEWDVSVGPELGMDESTGRILRAGDITYRSLLAWDVTRDPDSKSFEDCQWLYARIWVNKWDLAAMFEVDVLGRPAFDRIVQATDDSTVRALSGAVEFPKTGDLVPVYFFFHRPSPTMQLGREVLFVNAECVLRDRPLARVYTHGIPLCRYAVDEQFDTPYGYSTFWDTLAPQEVLDGVESAVASNILSYGNQSIAMEQGTTTPADHAYGGKVFQFPRGAEKPSALMLATMPPMALEYIQQKASNVLELLGLNDVFMGSPDTAQMNAQAFALLASMAVQANSPMQKRMLEALGNLGTHILKIYDRNVSVTRQIPIVGKHNASLFASEDFTKGDLASVDMVLVEVGNALEQTAPGRFQLANLYREMGFLQTPEQCMQVLETGKLEPATQSQRDKLLLVAAENEELRAGRMPPVHTFQDHLLHFRENAAVLESQEALKDEKVVRVTQEHCDWHYREYWGLPDHEIDPMTGLPVLDELGQPKKMAVQADPQFSVRIRIMLGQVPPPMMGPVDPAAAAGSAAPAPGPASGGPGGEVPALAPPPGPPVQNAQATANPAAGGLPFDPAGGGLIQAA